MIAIKRVQLAEHHLQPGRTRHALATPGGRVDFPPFTSLAITRYPGDPGFYLMHICADGKASDTWHENLGDALHQAEWEFGVAADEWLEANEPF